LEAESPEQEEVRNGRTGKNKRMSADEAKGTARDATKSMNMARGADRVMCADKLTDGVMDVDGAMGANKVTTMRMAKDSDKAKNVGMAVSENR
jgi:hypothetical protein